LLGAREPATAPLLARAVAVLASAAAYAAAFPPWNQPWLAFFVPVPLLWALRRSSAGGAALVGFVWGTACISFFGYWVPVGLANYWQQPAWFGFLFALGIAMVYKGSYFAVFGWLYHRLQARYSPFQRILLTATLYVTCELARASLLTGHPWLLLGYAAAPYTTWVQMADLGGVYLLSFTIVLFGASLVELLVGTHDARGRAVATALALAACAAPLVYGQSRTRQSFDTGPTARSIAVVQANHDLGTQWREEFYGSGLESYVRLSNEITASKPALLVWPENAMTFFLTDAPVYLSAIAGFVERADTQLVAGGPYFEPGRPDGPIYNSAFLITAEGIAGRYDKVHLLPFAEYFPLRTIRFLRREFERVRSFTPAAEAVLLDTAAGRAGVLICFEAIFPELVRREVRKGAELLLNLSNDAWLQSRAGGEQHLLMVRLRAIEFRRWVVRSTTTGVSAFIDPLGRIRGRIESGAAGTLLADVRRSDTETIYFHLGDLFAWLCVITTVVAFLFGRRSGASRNDGSR
jgi:apolipoprotein N-acyltransferase